MIVAVPVSLTSQGGAASQHTGTGGARVGTNPTHAMHAAAVFTVHINLTLFKLSFSQLVLGWPMLGKLNKAGPVTSGLPTLLVSYFGKFAAPNISHLSTVSISNLCQFCEKFGMSVLGVLQNRTTTH